MKQKKTNPLIWLASKIGLYPFMILMTFLFFALSHYIDKLQKYIPSAMKPFIIPILIAVVIIYLLCKLILTLKRRKKERILFEGRFLAEQREASFKPALISLQPLLSKDPYFNEHLFLEYASFLLETYWHTLLTKDSQPLIPCCSDLMLEQLQYELDDLNLQQVSESISLTFPQSLRITDYRCDAKDEYIEVSFSAMLKHYLINDSNQKRVKGDQNADEARTYKLTLIRQKELLTTNSISQVTTCKNCGGQIDLSASHYCPHCNSYYSMGSTNWLLNNLESTSRFE